MLVFISWFFILRLGNILYKYGVRDTLLKSCSATLNDLFTPTTTLLPREIDANGKSGSSTDFAFRVSTKEGWVSPVLYRSLLHEIIYSITIMSFRIIFAKQSGLNHVLHFESSRVMEHVCSCMGTRPKISIAGCFCAWLSSLFYTFSVNRSMGWSNGHIYNHSISSVKWSDPGHFLKAQGKFIFSFPCTLFYIFLTPKNYKLSF